MISVIITSFKEPNTIGRAIEAIENNLLVEKFEVIVGAPDDETLNAAAKLKNKYKNLVLIKDKGEGKPAALNLLVEKAKGDILILTDGDVYVSNNSLNFLIEKIKDEKIGAVSGRPVSIDVRNNKFGFWAYLLSEIANERRKKAIELNKRFFCSGYLFAIKKELFPKLDASLLSEDGFISHNVYQSGYRIDYSEQSEVYIKYPNNFSDWIKQKKRSAGGYNQLRKMLGIEMRSFKKESMGGYGLLKYVGGIREMFWLIELFFARVYLWMLIYKDINITKKNHKEIWERIESTK